MNIITGCSAYSAHCSLSFRNCWIKICTFARIYHKDKYRTMEEKNIEKEAAFDLEDLWSLFLSHWHWFVGCVIVSLCVAVLYVLHTTPVFTRSTQLLIREDDNSANGGSMLQEFQNLGLIGGNTNIKNEILTLSAPVLMEETVGRLHLDLQLQTTEGLRVRPFYNDAPLKLIFSTPFSDEQNFEFQIKLLENEAFEIHDFKAKDFEFPDVKISGRLGQTVKTPLGIIKVEKTPAWDGEMVGRELQVCKYPLSEVAKLYSRRLSVTLSDKDATVLNLALSDEIPERADDVLTSLIDVYNEHWVTDKNRMAQSTSQFISERLEALSKELGDVDQQISDYKSRNLLPDIEAVLAKDMQQSGRNYESLLELSNQLAMAQYILEYMNDHSKDGQLLPTNTGIPSTGIESAITEYNRTMLERNNYVENTSEHTSFIQEMDRSLAQQKMSILRSLENLIEQIKSQIANVERSDRDINSQIAQNPGQAEQLMAIGRQQKVKESLYIFLLQKREENELSRTYTAWNTSIIQPPYGSELPDSPRKMLCLLVAVVLGIAIPGGILFLRDMMDHTVRGRKDLDDIDIPMLGEIPDMFPARHWWQSKVRKPASVVVHKDTRNIINEAFRLVRTKLDYFAVTGEGGSKIIMVTSFNPGSGKSFIAMNLTQSFAIKGKRVLVIDADLRMATLSKAAGMKTGQQGISAYLTGMVTDVDSLIMRGKFDGDVDVLPVGVIPPNPAEILLSDRLRVLLEQMKERYDYVFLDCPPIEIVADASIIKKYADITLFVVRAGLMDRRVLPDVDQMYRENQYNRMVIVLNATKYVSGKYGSFRYGYSYGYGNHSNNYYMTK